MFISSIFLVELSDVKGGDTPLGFGPLPARLPAQSFQLTFQQYQLNSLFLVAVLHILGQGMDQPGQNA
jgi:hypothetical protein